ncbi:GDSL esterase/lipase [Carex littledalei]|uniref:GDSL esterase/lipase n=1 Tax=Carex littledalei TaxID=544730 RepID=A0A833R7R4_9POAL|nr:GDSL esterase/lipase [Carex littledalei]
MKKLLCLFLVLFCFVSPFVGATQPSQWKVPAIYVFGDSTVDVGNNNYLTRSRAKANFPHYGIDFPHSRPTGRFSNGYNAIDFIASHMGFRRSPPPYLFLNDTNNHQIVKGLRGVNFASAGSGILDSTGTNIITTTQQVLYFEALRSKMVAQSNADQVALRLSKSLFLISSGGNDAFAFATANKSPNNTAILLFYNTVISKYENHIKTLYGLGARYFAVINVPSIGCVPSARAKNPTGGCIDSMNQLAKGLNDAVAALFLKLSVTLPGLEYSIGNSYEFLSTVISKPRLYGGFEEVKSACCGGGKFNAESSCTPNATYCMKRSRYVFWDNTHPSQATSKLAGALFYDGPAQFVGPITFKQLVKSAY